MPLRDRLVRLDPGRAGLQTTAIAAVTGRVAEGLRLTARVEAPAQDAGWIGFDAGGAMIAMTPGIVDGTIVRITPGDGVAAAAALASLEPLVAAVEHAIARALHPASVDCAPDADAVVIAVEAEDRAGVPVHRALFAFPAGIGFMSPEKPCVTLPSLVLRWRAELEGPLVPAERFAGLGNGDLVLLGQRELAARIALPGVSGQYRARFDPRARSVLLTTSYMKRDRPMDLQDNPPRTAEDDVAGLPATLQVALSAEIDGGTIAIGDVAGLGEGSVLPLPAGTGALVVRIRAGETLIGEGEIVALGEGFGILVTTLGKA